MKMGYLFATLLTAWAAAESIDGRACHSSDACGHGESEDDVEHMKISLLQHRKTKNMELDNDATNESAMETALEGAEVHLTGITCCKWGNNNDKCEYKEMPEGAFKVDAPMDCRAKVAGASCAFQNNHCCTQSEYGTWWMFGGCY